MSDDISKLLDNMEKHPVMLVKGIRIKALILQHSQKQAARIKELEEKNAKLELVNAFYLEGMEKAADEIKGLKGDVKSWKRLLSECEEVRDLACDKVKSLKAEILAVTAALKFKEGELEGVKGEKLPEWEDCRRITIDAALKLTNLMPKHSFMLGLRSGFEFVIESLSGGEDG